MKKKNITNNKWGAPNFVFKIFFFFMIFLYVVLLVLCASPTVYGINMREFAEKRNTVNKVLTAKRGTIYDKDGNILSQNVSTYTVIAYLAKSRTTDDNKPRHVVNIEKTAIELAPLINMSIEDIKSLLQRDAYQVELGPGGRNITELVKSKIIELDLPGIDFIETVSRNYPNGNFASYIVGYSKPIEEEKEVNGKKTVNKVLTGELGIEQKFNNQLKGENGYLEFQQTLSGYKIPNTVERRKDAKNGDNIYLTIDSGIQRFTESIAESVKTVNNPKWMILTVMDAKTGAIVASSTLPSFDPNILDITNYENPLVTYAFEPGSTMKTFTYMCAIDKGTYKGDQIYSARPYHIANDVIKDWNRTGFGDITFDKGYSYSSNAAIANIVDIFITKSELKDCLYKYGFNEKTNIDLPRELSGDFEFNYPIEVAAAGFGQGITVTPIQMLQALSIIANDGYMVKPHIVDKITDSNNNVTYKHEINKKEDKVVKDTTVAKMKELMYKTINGTDEETMANNYKIDGISLMGKTGTAEIYSSEYRGYLPGYNDYIYSFSGIFPKEDPKYIIYFAYDRPEKGYQTGVVKAVRELVNSIKTYKNINNIPASNNTNIKLNNYINTNTVNAVTELKSLNVKPIIIGNGDIIVKQYPINGDIILPNEKIFLITNSNNIVMPDIKGYSRKELIELVKILGIKANINGYGYVINQSIEAGTLITKEMILNVELNNKYNIKKEN